ncbi:unnamed protein product [Coffea canephora]|uniref:Protein kinase domain-containing protein n=1 Tax=Coffea canephora TaxID=49390 RepID=A0A068UV08_COFCA|nr:unnamed protein product [Coffea canephora]
MIECWEKVDLEECTNVGFMISPHRMPKGGNQPVVAIKKLDPKSFQGTWEWMTEICKRGMLSHPNLIKFLGNYQKDEELLLLEIDHFKYLLGILQ